MSQTAKLLGLTAKGLKTSVATAFLMVMAACTPKRAVDFENDTKRDPKGDNQFTEALLSIDKAPNHNFADTAIGSVDTVTMTVTNGGKLAASAISGTGSIAAPFAYVGGAYPGTGGTCTTDLAVDASCTLVLEFAPTIVGTYTDRLELNYNDGLNTSMARVNLNGDGIVNTAMLAISDATTYDYGAVAVGSVANKTFTITNTGTAAASSIADAGGLAAPFTYVGGSYPGTAGTCSTSLAVAATCTIVVRFSPTAVSSYADTIEISYNDSIAAQTATRPIMGAGALASITINNGPTYDYGTRAPGSNTPVTFTLTNGGGYAASSLADGSGLAAPYQYYGGSYPGTGGTCSTSLAAAATCTIVVSFVPTVVGTFADTIVINYNDGQAAQSATRDVTGIAALALLTISDPATYDFGSQAVGSTTYKTFTVTNTGGVSATSLTSGTAMVAPFSWRGGTYPGTGGTCGSTLAASATCTVAVQFSPASVGSFSDTVTLSYNDGAGTQSATRPITGAGALALLTISDPVTYDYGVVGLTTTASKTFTVTNGGGIGATALADTGGLSAPYQYKDGSYPGTGGTCATTLAASATCTIIVDFVATVAGTFTDTIDLSYNDGQAAQNTTRALTGIAGGTAVLAISDPVTYDYGSQVVGSTTSKSFTITNSGNGAASSMADAGGLAAPYSFAGGSYPGTAGTCGATLAAAGTCTIVVNFAPTVAGVAADTIAIDYDDGVAAQSASRDVTGTGVAAVLSISDGATFDYGTQAVGTTTPKTFTVTNTGGYGASAMADSGGTVAPFAFVGGSYPGTGGTCAATLAAAATCTIIVNFAPTAAGTFSDTISLDYNDGSAAQSATRAVIGTGAAALLTITDFPTYDYGNVVKNATGSRSFTVANTGNLNATSILTSGLSAPINWKGGSYPGTGGNCGTSLAVSASCTLVIDFTPTAAGSFSRTLAISYYDGGATQSLNQGLTGTGTLAVLEISDGPTFDYGSVGVAVTASKTFTISNTGGREAVSVAAGTGPNTPFTYKGGSYPGTGGDCASTLAASDSCTIVVDFTPSSSGVASSTINVDYNDGLAAQTASRNVTGTGALAVLSISDGPTYDFGERTIGSTTSKTFTITNTGSAQASAIAGSTFSAPFSYAGGTAFPGTGGTCGTTLNAAASCTVIVRFQPTVPGPFSSTLTLDYFDSENNQSSARDIIASVPDAATLTLDPVAVDFGQTTVNSFAEQIVTITNDGEVAATSITPSTLSSPYSFVGDVYPGTGGSCGASLSAGASCTIVLKFLPLSDMVYDDVLSIEFNDGGQTTSVDLPLTGEGIESGMDAETPVIHLADQTTASGSGSSGTINKPGNLAAGDLIVLTYHLGTAAPAITPPAGFTHINTAATSTSSSAAKMAAYYKIATGSEPATYAITLSTSGSWRAYANRITGADPGSPIGVASTAASGTTGVDTLALPSINTTTANNLLLATWAMRSNTHSPVNPSGMTQAWTSPSSYGATQANSGAGSTGTRTLSWSYYRAAAGILMSVRPVIEEAPGAPLSLAATVVGSGQVRLNWALPSVGGSPETYYIERATDSGGVPGAYSAVDSTASREYLDTGLTNGLTYWYRVYAENSYGVGNNSTAVSVTLEAVPVIHVANAKTATGATGSVNIEKPTNLSEGDLIILVYNITPGSVSYSTITPPSGFTLIRNSGSYNHARVAAYRKIATASEPSTYSISISGANSWNAYIVGVTGYDTVTPIGPNNAVDSGSTTVATLTIPSVTTTVSDEVMFSAWTHGGTTAGTPTNPAGMTQIYSITSIMPTMRGFSETRPSAGATGTRTFSWSGLERAAGLVFTIRPATW